MVGGKNYIWVRGMSNLQSEDVTSNIEGLNKSNLGFTRGGKRETME